LKGAPVDIQQNILAVDEAKKKADETVLEKEMMVKIVM
jgi:hypothetical protein